MCSGVWCCVEDSEWCKFNVDGAKAKSSSGVYVRTGVAAGASMSTLIWSRLLSEDLLLEVDDEDGLRLWKGT